MTVRNMTSPKTNREVPNQFIVEISLNGNEVTVFQSYTSDIATIDWNEYDIALGSNWDYSNTTGKYRNRFFEEMGFKSLSTKKGIEDALKLGYVEQQYTCIHYSIHLDK